MGESTRATWLKWGVGTVIALVGAGGGGVAVMDYLDDRRATAREQYREELAAWEAFSPESLSGAPQEAEILGGWFVDLDLGRVAMSLTGPAWDLSFRIRDRAWIGLLANENVEWAELGVVDFDAVEYRTLRDAEFRSARAGRGDKFLYLSHTTAAPGPGYTFAVRLPTDRVAKVQILDYEHSATLGPRGVTVRYEVFPIEADPPRPRRP